MEDGKQTNGAGVPDAALRGRRVLVTGAGGQLGGYLRAILADAGATAVGLGSTPGPGIDAVVDIADGAATRAAIEAAAPDAIVHGAAYTNVDGAERDPERAEAVNGAGSRHVAEAARALGVYLVAVGTDFVFDGAGGAPYGEDATPNPLSAYGRTKLSGERAVLAADPSFAVARTAWVYGGPGKHFPRTVLTVLRDRGGMDVVADEAGSPTFAGDLAAALLGLVAVSGAGLFHLTNAGRTTRFELAREVARVAGFDPELVRPMSMADFQAKNPQTAFRPQDGALTNERAAALGVRLRPWQEPIGAYVPRLAAELGLAGASNPAPVETAAGKEG